MGKGAYRVSTNGICHYTMNFTDSFNVFPCPFGSQTGSSTYMMQGRWQKERNQRNIKHVDSEVYLP